MLRVACLILVMALAGCTRLSTSSNVTSPTQRPAAAPADACSAKVIVGTFPGKPDIEGVRLGPLLLTGFKSLSDARLAWKPGYPTKLVFWATDRVDDGAQLQGFRCLDNRTLKFWFREGLPFDQASLPVSEDVMQTTGDEAASAGPMTASANFTRGGYLLVGARGHWALELVDNGRLLAGTVLIAAS